MKHFKKYWHLYALATIFLIGLFFRIYHIVERYTYAHDADLIGWVIKDIVVNHHIRLIGQLTSVNGIYIGPIFYYSLIPFYLLTKMDPVGSLIPITFLGMATLLSYYFVFSRLFNKSIGLLATFIEAVSIPIVTLDRWVVPSTPTNIWQVWYFFTVIMLSRGNFSVLPLLGFLIAMIWEIHIALIPALLAVPVAIYSSKKLPTLKQTLLFFITLIISSTPLILFEVKHNFIQTQSFFRYFLSNKGGGAGLEKFATVIAKFGSTIAMNFFYQLPFNYILGPIITLGILLLPVLLIKQKIIKSKEMKILYVWVLAVLAFFMISSTPVSEYYFFNTFIVFKF